MTPTSKERREVAARLRKCGAELSIIDADCETAFHVIDKAIGCRKEDSWERFLARLADLIDPTCHVREYGHHDELRVVGCSVCRFGWLEDVHGIPNRFYPYCGARVVEGGEG